MSESATLRIARQVATRLGVLCCWRNNVGQAWQARIRRKEGRDLVLVDARPIRFGLIEGSADLILCVPRVIQAADVGKRIGVFAGFETKYSTKLETAQITFSKNVHSAGGRVFEIRDEKQAEQSIREIMFEAWP